MLSESTEAKDRTKKLDHYKTIKSLQQYWIISQTRRRIEVWQRSGETWSAAEYARQDAFIPLAALDASVLLGDVYEDVSS